MKVRAKRLGYYNHQRKKPEDEGGKAFHLKKDSDFSDKWMEKVEDNSRRPEPSSKKPKKEEASSDSEVI